MNTKKIVSGPDGNDMDARDDDLSYELRDLKEALDAGFRDVIAERRDYIGQSDLWSNPRARQLGYAILSQVQDDLRSGLARIDVNSGKSAAAHRAKSEPVPTAEAGAHELYR